MIKFRNPIFEKSLALLAHPVSLAALALLLFNDQILRRFWPSWWTGKISDAAWMVVAPLFLAALLSWLLPHREGSNRQQLRVFVIAFLAIGISFTLVKLVPLVNLLATRSMAIFLGAKPALSLDPTDLLALPALAIPFWLWRTGRMEATSNAAGMEIRSVIGSVAAGESQEAGMETRPTRQVLRGLILLPLAAVVLLADAAAPDMGIVCFQAVDGRILGDAGYSSYVSTDGGLHWENGQPGLPVSCKTKPSAPGAWVQVSGPRDGLLYRYQTDQEIQLSTDGGATWQTAMKLRPATEQEQLFVRKTRSGNAMFTPGPMDALVDPASGNTLFAMGLQGVLVHTASDAWVWGQGAGANQPVERFPDAAAFDALLGGMVYMAVALALLIYAALAVRWTRHPIRLVVLALAWLGWLVLDGIFPPATMTNYGAAISGLGLLLVLLFILPLAIEQTFRLVRRAPRRIGLLLAFSLGGGVLYFAPYVLWLYNLVSFSAASLAAALLALAALVAGLLVLRRAEPRKPAGEILPSTGTK